MTARKRNRGQGTSDPDQTKLKAEFLSLFSKHYGYYVPCKRLGIRREQVELWSQNDQSFREKLNACTADQERRLFEFVERAYRKLVARTGRDPLKWGIARRANRGKK